MFTFILWGVKELLQDKLAPWFTAKLKTALRVLLSKYVYIFFRVNLVAFVVEL